MQLKEMTASNKSWGFYIFGCVIDYYFLVIILSVLGLLGHLCINYVDCSWLSQVTEAKLNSQSPIKW